MFPPSTRGAPRGDRAEIAIVGGGPRGLSVLERICANVTWSDRAVPVLVHVVDPHAPGAGSVWRTDQNPLLLMNTVAAQVTVFTDESVDCDGPVVPGPSLHEWTRHVSGNDPLNAFRLPAAIRAEALALGADDYPSRALYGAYLRWAFQYVLAAAPAGVEMRYHRAVAVELVDDDGREGLRLDDGTELTGLAAVVLAQGHTAERPTAEQERFAAAADEHGLVYVTPANPADTDLSGIAAGERVVLRGQGLNYFDYQTLLTSGRGGRFARDERGRLGYEPSGREPRLVVGSRRGVPYQARGDNQKAPDQRAEPAVLTAERVATLRARAREHGDVDFRAQIWPLVALEVELTYYGLALRGHLAPERLADFRAAYLACDADVDGRGAVLDAFGVPAALRWSWERVQRPYGAQRFDDRDAWSRWLLEHLDEDARLAGEGNLGGATKSALDALRDLRNEVRQLVDHGGVRGRSYADDIQAWFTPLNASLSIGPPRTRIEEMAALVRAGVVEVVGPEMTVGLEGGAFVTRSPAVPGPPVRARALIEARLPETSLPTSADPLMRRLLETGEGAQYQIHDPVQGESVVFGGLAVTERPFRVVDAQGRAHPRRLAFGVPTESVHWVSAAGARPGVNSVTLSDADSIAREMLALCARQAEPAAPRQSLAAPTPLRRRRPAALPPTTGLEEAS